MRAGGAKIFGCFYFQNKDLMLSNPMVAGFWGGGHMILWPPLFGFGYPGYASVVAESRGLISGFTLDPMGVLSVRLDTSID